MARAWRLGTLRYAFEQTQGKQFALNCGIGLARHEILAFTDDDIILSKDWIRNIANVFADPVLDLAGGKTLVQWPKSGRPPWFAPAMSAIVGAFDNGEERQCPPPPGYAPAGANLVARRSLFERVGRYSEAHFRHMDYEFGVRCLRKGARVAYEPSLVVHAPVDCAILTKRYFRRWSFKAGIARDDAEQAASTGSLRVPSWVYRQFIEDCLFVALGSLRAEAADVFARELRAWRAFGTIASSWYARVRPLAHSNWVEKHSQKKNGVY